MKTKLLLYICILMFQIKPAAQEKTSKELKVLELEVIYLHAPTKIRAVNEKEFEYLVNAYLQKCFTLIIQRPCSFADITKLIAEKLKMDSYKFRLASDIENDFLTSCWNMKNFDTTVTEDIIALWERCQEYSKQNYIKPDNEYEYRKPDSNTALKKVFVIQEDDQLHLYDHCH